MFIFREVFRLDIKLSVGDLPIIPKLLITLAMILINFSPGCAQEYGKVMKDKLTDIFGGKEFKDSKDFEWVPYPTNNFGLMTIFVMSRPAARPRERDRWCATYSCLHYKETPTNENEIIKLKGFADVGQGGEINLTDIEKRKLELAVLGKLFAVLNLKTAFNRERDVEVNLGVLYAWKRSINKERLLDYLTRDPETNPDIKKAFNERRLAIVMDDVIVGPFDLSIKVSKAKNNQLSGELDKKVGAFGVGSSLEVKASKDDQGTYHYKIGQPVIVGRLTVNQKEPFFDPTLGLTKNEENTAWVWTPTKIIGSQPKRSKRSRK